MSASGAQLAVVIDERLHWGLRGVEPIEFCSLKEDAEVLVEQDVGVEHDRAPPDLPRAVHEQGRTRLRLKYFGAMVPRCGSMALNETGLDQAKEVRSQALVAYLCRFRPEPEGGFTVTCPKLPAVVTYGATLEEAQANAREAIELCLEVMREDGQPIPPHDGDLASPIDQRCRSLTRTDETAAGASAASSSRHWSEPL